MNLPVVANIGPNAPGSNIRNIGASTQKGIVNSVGVAQGSALLVYNGAPGGSGGVGTSLYGSQVLNAAANAQKLTLGTMIVAEGSSLSGTVYNTSTVPGVLLIEDANGNIIAQVPMPIGVPVDFDPSNYPQLANIGALADQRNNALGNYISLGQTPIGWEYANAANPGANDVIGWANAGGGYLSINPATFPMSLLQFYIAATDSLYALGFAPYGIQPSAAYNGGQQNIILFDPNGNPISNTAYDPAIEGDYNSLTNTGFSIYAPGLPIIPGWWSIVDNGKGNDLWYTGIFDSNFYNGLNLVLGGGTPIDDGYCGLYVAAPGSIVNTIRNWEDTSTSQRYLPAGFNYLTRFQYKAAATLYKQSIQKLTFIVLFASVPTSGTITISGVS